MISMGQSITAVSYTHLDVLGVARVAGIMGVKRTSELIPMCHPLPIQKCSVDYELDETNGICLLYTSRCV